MQGRDEGGGGIPDLTAVRDQIFMRQHSYTEARYMIMNV